MLFDRYFPDQNLRESQEFSEKELKDLVKDIFIKMKEKYKENL